MLMPKPLPGNREELLVPCSECPYTMLCYQGRFGGPDRDMRHARLCILCGIFILGPQLTNKKGRECWDVFFCQLRSPAVWNNEIRVGGEDIHALRKTLNKPELVYLAGPDPGPGPLILLHCCHACRTCES